VCVCGGVCVCEWVCVCVCVFARARARVCVCVCLSIKDKRKQNCAISLQMLRAIYMNNNLPILLITFPFHNTIQCRLSPSNINKLIEHMCIKICYIVLYL